MTEGQSVSTSYCRAHYRTCDQKLILSESCCLASEGRPRWREVRSISCQSLSAVIVHCQVLLEVEITLRLKVSQSVCRSVEPTLGHVTRYYFLSEGYCLKVAVLFLWGALSDERTGLQFAVQSLNGPDRAEPVTYFTISSETPPTWRVRFPYLYSPGKWCRSYTQVIRFLLRRLLRLTGLWWRYSNPPSTWKARSP
jgi:hypothetical protein